MSPKNRLVSSVIACSGVPRDVSVVQEFIFTMYQIHSTVPTTVAIRTKLNNVPIIIPAPWVDDNPEAPLSLSEGVVLTSTLLKPSFKLGLDDPIIAYKSML